MKPSSRPVLTFLAAAAALAVITAIFLAYRQPGMLLEFLSLRYCG